MGHETGQDCVTDCKAFSTLQNNTGILFSFEEGCFYLETEWFLPIIGDKSRRSDWNLWVQVQTRVWAILSALAQMSRARGDVSTWQILFGVWVCLELTEPLWWLCNQISQNNENCNSLRASSLFKGYQEKSCANGTQKEMQEQGVGKESESLSFPFSFRALPLTHAFTCHSKWRVCSQFITFLCSHAYLLFGEPVYVWNSEEKFKLLTY